jgi:hypothetical protein
MHVTSVSAAKKNKPSALRGFHVGPTSVRLNEVEGLAIKKKYLSSRRGLFWGETEGLAEGPAGNSGGGSDVQVGK